MVYFVYLNLMVSFSQDVFSEAFFLTKANLKDPKRTRKEIEAMSGKDTLKGVTKHVQNVLV